MGSNVCNGCFIVAGHSQWGRKKTRSDKKSEDTKYFLVKRGGGRQGAPTTVRQATAGLSYLGTSPDREAGISCCWHCLSQSRKIQYKHTHMHHTHTCWYISAFIWHCWASTGLGLFGQVASKHPPWWAGTAAQPNNQHPLINYCLSDDPFFKQQQS